MKLPWVVSTLFFLAARALPAAAQDDDYLRCGKYRKSNPDLALQYCSAAILSGKLSQEQLAETHDNRGDAFESSGEYDRAIQDYDKAIELKPDFAEAFYGRGYAFDEKGEYHLAIWDYDQAIRLQPNNAKAFNNRGNTHYSLGQHDEALKDYDKAIELKPDFAEAFSNRGTVFMPTGNYDRAMQDFEQAIRLKPDYFSAVRNRGLLFVIKGMYDRAALDFDQAIRLKPDFGPSYLDRGCVRFIGGKFAAAQQDFARMLQLKPNDPYAAIWLYLAIAKQGQDARGELAKNATRFDSRAWLVQVVNFYLDKAAAGPVLDSAKDPDMKTDREHHCQAYFFLGEYALLAGKQEDAKHLFQLSVETGVTYYIEYLESQKELERLAIHK